MIDNYPMFIDCGAPSLYNKLSRKLYKKGIMGSKLSERKYDDFSYTQTKEYIQYRDNYIKFLHEHKDRYDIFSNLDVINSPELTWQNQKFLESSGLHPIPVFHIGCDEKWLKKYMDKYDYIALGGLVPNPTSVLIPWLDRIFKDYILDGKGFPRVKIHGFACTSLPLMARFPWYSVDSVTCRKLAMYGSIFEPECTSNDLKVVQISTRDIEMKYRGIPPKELIKLKSIGKKYNIGIEQLGASTTFREIWNYTILLKAIDNCVPKWPWNYFTRESRPDAKKHLTVFYAGDNLHYEEEFWQHINKIFPTRDFKGRLMSFFYAGRKPETINKY